MQDWSDRLGGPQDLFFARSDTVPRPTLVRGQGVWLFDEDGREYLDVSSGPVTANIGHGDSVVAEAMAKQAAELAFVSARQARHNPNIELAERIAGLAGEGFERVLFGSGGSEAVEFAVKLVRQRALAAGEDQRCHVITCMPSYHGSTIGALGLSGDPSNERFLDGFARNHPKVPAPLSYRVPGNVDAARYADNCATRLEETILELGPDSVLAFLIEPVGGLATGALVLPDSYLCAVRDICDRYGIVLIFDEVLCGAGRTGRFLASHHEPAVKPDLCVLAKGLSAGYAPLGAVLAPASWVDWLSERLGFGFTHTYSAHPVSAAAALAVLDRYQRDKLDAAAERMGRYLRAGLERLRNSNPMIGDVRGKGLLLAVELVADQTGKQPIQCEPAATDLVRTRGLDHGLLIYARRTAGGAYGEWIMVTPPLTIDEAECDELIQRLQRTLSDVYEDLVKRGAVRT